MSPVNIRHGMIDFRKVNGSGAFYFIRHGESEGNHAGILQGRQDYPLSEKGRRQARKAGSWFKGKNIEIILSSPLLRVSQTADIVARQLGLPGFRIDENLTELDTGLFTGMTVREVRDRYPGEWEIFLRESWEGVPRAERINELLSRAEKHWENVLNLFQSGKRNILSVTHSGIMQWLIKASLGHKTWMPLFTMGNCGICRFSLDNLIDPKRNKFYYEWTYLNLSPGGSGKND